MGLPEGYVEPRAERLAHFAQVAGTPPARLADLVEDAALPLEHRLAAGTALALVGDPRIDWEAPEMLPVPAGRALLGTPDSEVDALHADSAQFGVQRSWVAKECPRHTLPIAAFNIAKYPVTNGEFAVFLKDTGHPELPSNWNYGRFDPAAANHPVYTVTAESADAYAHWLGRRTGRRFRLPTEQEWEYAAAGPEGLRHPWGDTFSAQAANTLETGLLMTSPVGAFPEGRSWCGALDMAGNVEEYTSSTYGPYPGGEIVHDDLYRRLGAYRIARGGAFNRFRDLARCQRRHGPYPRSLYAMGFRLAEDAQASGKE
ncbi:formylglycine-generating enzyme family protein (plasmid) [Streptomyces sp. BHT-5-2]|uniref:formylglycine-generating enzyme family protein n=1 Tax=Streptomyces sp. BHT-5-2 TaxID=2866715 RepID=UPI001C8DB2DB|nr:SUMF1/EgtB/PvdO family nonheme iron enzyme [Streptomyces sp. BHT-5-2]QZL09283.1 formylglycine-generating enzyme family protein [Streptomyces sp. BHT-5-2]